MSRSDITYLHDIVESVNLILKYIEHKTEFEFINDVMLQDAVNRRFEIIGEQHPEFLTPLKKTIPLYIGV